VRIFGEARVRTGHVQLDRVVAEAGECPSDPPGRFLGHVGGLDRLFPDPERVDFCLQALAGDGDPLLLADQNAELTGEVGHLFPDRRLAGAGLAGQVLPTDLERPGLLAGEPLGTVLELGDLELDALP